MKIELCAFADEAAADLQGQIAALRRNGIGKIELRSIDGVNVKDLTIEAARRAAAELSAASVAVWSLGSPIGKSDICGDFTEVQRDFEHILRLCEIFDCHRVRIFSFFTADYERVQAEVIRRLRVLVGRAKEAGVLLCHENEKDIFGDRAQRVQYLLDNVEGLRSVYDPANYVQMNESAEEMARMRQRADYYHIKDALRTGELVPAGEGDGDISALVRELDCDTVLTLEPHLAVFAGYAAIDKHEMKNKYRFASGDEAFDTAVAALKKILAARGLKEIDGAFVM